MSAAWQVKKADARRVDLFAAELALPRLVAGVLALRHQGLDDARRYLEPRLGLLAPPEGMADLERTVARLCRAILHKEVVGVFGDYDVDGVTSGAVVGDFLARAGATVKLRVARRDEGYGFGVAQAQELLGAGCGLLVLTDCGTSDDLAVKVVADAGVDLIAVDHHRISDVSGWPGYALINPQRPDCAFADKDLCSAGLAFYLIAALRRALTEAGVDAPDPRESLDLVALGTVADVARLTGNNRILVAKGLEQVQRTVRPGLRELMRLADLGGKLPSTTDVGWRIAPRLNAPGRMGDAAVALDCLWQRDVERGVASARRCDAINEQRKEIQRRILEQALTQAQGRADDAFCLVADDCWHPGVNGIVAAKLSETFGRPAAVVSWEGDSGRASARSVPGVDLYELLGQCAPHLRRFGGHAAAAGFSVERARLEPLRAALCAAAAPLLAGLQARQTHVDGVVELAEIDMALVGALRRLEPHGNGNDQPRFAAGGLKVESSRVVGSDHLSLLLRQGQAVRPAIGFGMASAWRPEAGALVDAAFAIEEDDWNGPRIRLRLHDLVPAGEGLPNGVSGGADGR